MMIMTVKERVEIKIQTKVFFYRLAGFSCLYERKKERKEEKKN